MFFQCAGDAWCVGIGCGQRRAECGFELLRRDPARAQQAWYRARTIDDGGFDADIGCSTVEHAGDTVAEFFTHMRSGRCRNTTETIG